MTLNSKIITGIYGMLGAVFLLLGLLGLFQPKLSLQAFDNVDLSTPIIAKLADTIVHFTMELSASIIALGSLLLWGSFKVTTSKKLDYLFVGYFVLFSGLHWFEFFQDNRTIMSPLINSIPLFLFIIILLLRPKTKTVV